MSLISWFIETYLEDRYVPREDFDHVQAREFPIIQRDMERVRAQRNDLQRENHELKREVLHSVGMLPTWEDDDGQISAETRCNFMRDRFCFRIEATISDDIVRVTRRRQSPRILDHLAESFKRYFRKQLEEKFAPKFPG